MEIKKLQVGDVVLSKQGRDVGNYFVVSSVIDDSFVTLVDGKYHKITKPKKKKIKHLKATNDSFSIIGEKFTNGKIVHDSELYSALRAFNEEKID